MTYSLAFKNFGPKLVFNDGTVLSPWHDGKKSELLLAPPCLEILGSAPDVDSVYTNSGRLSAMVETTDASERQ